MLYYTGRGTYTTTGTITTYDDGDHTYASHCQCPHCGNVHQCRIEYVTYPSNFGFVDQEPEPVSPPERFPRPTNDPYRAHQVVMATRTAHSRHARPVGHRGYFRNFHK